MFRATWSRCAVTPCRALRYPDVPCSPPTSRQPGAALVRRPMRSRPSSRSSPTNMPAASASCARAVAQRLKAALAEGPRAGRAVAAEGPPRAGAAPSGCASCRMRSSACCSTSSPRISIAPQSRRTPSAWRSSRPAATAAACSRPAPTSICLFLLPYKQTAWGESVAEGILYCLWDMGLKVGHATRSVDECIRQAKADMTIRTALLEARYPARRPRAVRRVRSRASTRTSCRARRPQFVAAKLAEREERLRRAGQSRYLVEPNVKDGKGGLRDLHTLFWIAKYVYRVHERRGADRARRVRSRRNTRCSAAPRISSGRCAATCISSPAAPRSGCRSTSSARSRCGSATRRIPACRTSSAS